MPRESWELWHDDYYDQLEAEDYEGLDDLEEWKEEVIGVGLLLWI